VVRKALICRALTVLGAVAIGTTGVASAANDTVKIGVDSVYPAYAIFSAGRDLGFYSAANISVEIQPFRTAAASGDSLAAGQTDLVPITPSAVVAAQAKGAKERIVALFAPPRATGWYIMVPAGSPARTLADLKGKTIGVPHAGAPSDVWLRTVAPTMKPPFTTTAVGNGAIAALQSKRVDAAVVAPAGSYASIIGGDMRAILALETALPPMVFQGVGATQDMIEKRPDVLKRWIAATSKTVDYMQTHEAWSIDFLKQYLDTSDDTIVHLIYDDYIRKINMPGTMHPDWMRAALPAGAKPVAQADVENVFLVPSASKKRHSKL
jgi:NitT/TauT family transport system substrate-binding protein